ncbi:MAG: putative DNA-binding domain-containing protein, partial [Methylophilaceae bacterium]|nr:putative DNA-binding domain-containing protein [Methylophilaceae bacterium]
MSAFQRYQAEFVAYIRDPKSHPRPNGTARRGMTVYAEIVFNHMDDTLSACFPVCRKVLGVRRWKKLVRAFLAQHRCTPPFFHQIPEEWLRWLETAPAVARDLPPILMSLAHYEWVELAVATSDATPAAHDPQGDWLEGRPVLAPALMLLRY